MKQAAFFYLLGLGLGRGEVLLGACQSRIMEDLEARHFSDIGRIRLEGVDEFPDDGLLLLRVVVQRSEEAEVIQAARPCQGHSDVSRRESPALYPKVDEKSSLLERQALSEKVGEGIAQSED